VLTLFNHDEISNASKDWLRSAVTTFASANSNKKC
jgi:hypothetical protein